MGAPWIIIDVSNICHRAFHSMRGGMPSTDVWDAVQYGFYRDVAYFCRKFRPKGVLFAFDSPSGHTKRDDIYADYKGERKRKRKELTEEEREARSELTRTITNIRNIGAGMCGNGYARSLIQEGYEADDLMALAAQQVDRALIISSDEDLYQCLAPKTAVWSPNTKKLTTLRSFREEYGVEPSQWATVKAMAGCSSDTIKGLVGIGEKTAIKYLRRELGTHLKTYQTIKGPDTRALMRLNLQLTTLPMKGAEIIEPVAGKIDPYRWDAYMTALEFPSLVGALKTDDNDRAWASRRRSKKKKPQGGLLDG